MAQREDTHKPPTVMTADGTVKSVPGILFGALISWGGTGDGAATAGDLIVFRDGGATGTIRFHFVIESTRGSEYVPCGKYGIPFDTDIYYSEQATAAGRIRVTPFFD